MAEHHIGWVEEPLTPQDFDGYARLRQKSPVPIATGEALYTVFDFKRLLDVGGVDVIQPDLSLCSGFWPGDASPTSQRPIMSDCLHMSGPGTLL